MHPCAAVRAAAGQNAESLISIDERMLPGVVLSGEWRPGPLKNTLSQPVPFGSRAWAVNHPAVLPKPIASDHARSRASENNTSVG